MAGKASSKRRPTISKKAEVIEPVPLSRLVRLKNLTPKAVALTLDHRSVCIRTGKCLCSKMVRRIPIIVDGIAGFKPEERLIASSITVRVGKPDQYPRYVLLAAGVQAAIESGIIRNLSAS